MTEQFLTWLQKRGGERRVLSVENLVQEAGDAGSVAVVVVDLLEGFCRQGALASEEVGAIVSPTVEFLEQAHGLGVTRFYFPCDAHPADSPEFEAFPPHCIEGTEESRLVKELRQMEAAHLFQRMDKKSVSSLIGTGLAEQLEGEGVGTVICTGDCTDLCLYHLAVGLRCWANSRNLRWRIVVPQNLVATYHLGLEEALEIGALPHPAEFMSRVFLYHLELNGVEVVTLS